VGRVVRANSSTSWSSRGPLDIAYRPHVHRLNSITRLTIAPTSSSILHSTARSLHVPYRCHHSHITQAGRIINHGHTGLQTQPAHELLYTGLFPGPRLR